VGSVKRNNTRRGDAVADLPGIPQPVGPFVLPVVLTEWDSDSAKLPLPGKPVCRSPSNAPIELAGVRLTGAQAVRLTGAQALCAQR
jgi:hypothetical protein